MVATLDPNDKVKSNDVESALHDQQMADSSLKMIVDCISDDILLGNEKESCHLIQSCDKITVLHRILYHIEGYKTL